MIPTRLRPHVSAATVAALAALLGACAPAMIPAGKLTPVRDRITDEAIARDLAIFDSYDRRLAAAAPNPTGAQRYVAARAAEYVRVARDAYERNDRTTFVDDALQWAAADIESLERGEAAATPSAPPSVGMTQGTNAELWARANELRGQAATLANASDVARAEAQLLRAAHAFLTGPACVVESPLLAAARFLDDAGKGGKVPPAAPPPSIEPPPAVEPPPAAGPPPTPPPPARTDCLAADELRGVPSIVHFALDKHYLSPETKTVLDALIEKVGPYTGIRVVLGGHTDIRASDEYNQALSERRVNAVKDYLLSRGFDPARIEIHAYGEKRTLTNGTARMDHARNRRVAITYILCDGSEVGPNEQLNDIQLEAERKAREYKEK